MSEEEGGTVEGGGESTAVSEGAESNVVEGVESTSESVLASSESAVPESYEYTMPEGMDINQGLADAMSPLLQEKGFTQDEVNALTEAYAKSVQDSSTADGEATQQAYSDQMDAWAAELKNDADVGGEAFDENAGIAMKAIKQFGAEGLFEFLESSGNSNNPVLFKTFVAIGKTLSEDQPGSGNAAAIESSIEGRLYPNEQATH